MGRKWHSRSSVYRFGGLRCPSEVLSLPWADVDLPAGTMWVRSPKTEHHAGGEGRLVPIFGRLRPYLEEAWDRAREGQTHVIPEDRYLSASQGPAGWRNANLRTTFAKIIGRAGLKPWERLFHAMRASCETDLSAEFPIGAVCRWLGNTRAVAARHYLQPRDADFQRAIGGGEKSGALEAHNPAQKPSEIVRGGSQFPTEPLAACGVLRCMSEPNSLLHNDLVEDIGLEPTTF